MLASCASSGDTSSGGAVEESVGLSGAWSIEVSDPDGAVVSTAQTPNVFFGQEFVANLLGGAVSGPWSIIFVVPNNGCPRVDGPTECRIIQPGFPREADSENLTVTVNGPVVTLSGSFVSPVDNTITAVVSHQWQCGVIVPIEDCGPDEVGQTQAPMSRADFNPPIEITTGQTVSVVYTLTVG